LDAGAGRTDVSLWISQKLGRESECAGATERRTKRGGEGEPRRETRRLLGTGVAPNRLSSEQAQNGWGEKKKDDEKIAVLVLT